MNLKRVATFSHNMKIKLVTSHEYRTILLERPCIKICFLVTCSPTCTHVGVQELLSLLRDLCFTGMPSARDQKRRELVEVRNELIHAYHRMTKRAQKKATRLRDFIGGSPDSSGNSVALKEAFGRKPISAGFAPPPQLEGDALCNARCVKTCIRVTD